MSMCEEILLLLEPLVHDNASIQGIVAFQGCFPVLLDIIEDEGVADGGEIVQVHIGILAQNSFQYILSIINSGTSIIGISCVDFLFF